MNESMHEDPAALVKCYFAGFGPLLADLLAVNGRLTRSLAISLKLVGGNRFFLDDRCVPRDALIRLVRTYTSCSVLFATSEITGSGRLVGTSRDDNGDGTWK